MESASAVRRTGAGITLERWQEEALPQDGPTPKSLPIYKDSRPAVAAHLGLTQSLRRHCCRSARIPAFLEAAQTTQLMSSALSLKQFVTSS
jgi:hypothetical protein